MVYPPCCTQGIPSAAPPHCRQGHHCCCSQRCGTRSYEQLQQRLLGPRPCCCPSIVGSASCSPEELSHQATPRLMGFPTGERCGRLCRSLSLQGKGPAQLPSQQECSPATRCPQVARIVAVRAKLLELGTTGSPPRAYKLSRGRQRYEPNQSLPVPSAF